MARLGLVCFTFAALFAVALSESGICSWYGEGLPKNALTANGEHFDPHGLTAAHKTLPFGTHVHVTIGSHSVTVRINDRGPFVAGRILDVSPVAAEKLGIKGAKGVAHCEIKKV